MHKEQKSKELKSLQITHPEIAKQWHPTKNGSLKPTDVTYGSRKKVWWFLPYDDPQTGQHFDFEWQAQIYRMVVNKHCPFLIGWAIWVGFNDLATINPELAKEWHPTKNADLSPTQVTICSSKKVWWVGKCGHEWQAKIVDRSYGNGCPYCSSQKVLRGFNDLQTTHPNIAAQWHQTKNGILKPTDVMPGSHKKVWWKCENGHEWKTSIQCRTKGSGCPTCRKENQTSFPENAFFFYIKQTYPDAVQSYKPHWLNTMEIDIFIPSLSLGIEYDGYAWHQNVEKDKYKNKLCEENNVHLIRIRESKCPAIEGDCISIHSYEYKEIQRAISVLFREYLFTSININIDRDIIKIRDMVHHMRKKNSLLTINPRLAKEWHPTKNGNLKPEHVTCSSMKKVWWMCERGHEWQASVASRNQKNGCPYCSNQKLMVGVNDLKTVKPQIAKEWHPTKNNNLMPSMFFSHSTARVWWKCSLCGNEWQTTIANRGVNVGCPICAAKNKGLSKIEAMRKIRLGEVHTMRCGLKGKIINYETSANITVQFENGVIKQTSYSNFAKGAVSPN